MKALVVASQTHITCFWSPFYLFLPLVLLLSHLLFAKKSFQVNLSKSKQSWNTWKNKTGSTKTLSIPIFTIIVFIHSFYHLSYYVNPSSIFLLLSLFLQLTYFSPQVTWIRPAHKSCQRSSEWDNERKRKRNWREMEGERNRERIGERKKKIVSGVTSSIVWLSLKWPQFMM